MDKEAIAQLSFYVVVFSTFVGIVLLARRKYITGVICLLLAAALAYHWLSELYQRFSH